MLRNVVRRPSPATIIALIALIVIAAPLADAAQDAVQNPKASSAQKKKSKKVERARWADKAKFADNAGKVRGYSVGFAALPSRLVLTGPNGRLPATVIPTGVPGIAAGPRGSAGPAGPAGAAGPTGPAGGFSRVRIQFDPNPTTGLDGVGSSTVACNADEKVSGGGHELLLPVRAGTSDRSVVEITKSTPVVINAAAGTSGWSVQAVRIPAAVVFVDDPNHPGTPVARQNSSPAAAEKLVRVRAYAVCVSK